MKKFRLIAVLALCLSMIVGLVGCSGEQTHIAEGETNNSTEEEMLNGYTIGVAVYDNSNPEVMAMRNYMVNYLESVYAVHFLYSQNIQDADDELEFVDQLNELGVKAMFSCNSAYAATTVPQCEEYGIYYIAPTTNLTNEQFAEVEGYDHFLGSIGPSLQDETDAGAELASFFAADDDNNENSYLVFCGSGSRNIAHGLRTQAVLETLASEYNFTYDEPVEDIVAAVETTTTVYDGTVKITLVPGYDFIQDASVVENLLAGGEYNTVISVLSCTNIPEAAAAVEAETGMNIRIAAVDSFTEEYFELFHTEDPTGDTSINALVGKYASWMAPAYAIMANNLAGHHEEFTDNGAPFRIDQGFWYAFDADQFDDLYAHSISVADNSRSAEQITNLLRGFNPDADFELVREFAEAGNMAH